MSARKRKTGCPAGKALVKLRERTGLNQTEFWNRLGVTQSGGSRYENGRGMPKPVQVLVQIAYGSSTDASNLVAGLRGEKEAGSAGLLAIPKAVGVVRPVSIFRADFVLHHPAPGSRRHNLRQSTSITFPMVYTA